MSEKVLIVASVVTSGDSYYKVKLDTGLGDPEQIVSRDKVISMDRLRCSETAKPTRTRTKKVRA